MTLIQPYLQTGIGVDWNEAGSMKQNDGKIHGLKQKNCLWLRDERNYKNNN